MQTAEKRNPVPAVREQIKGEAMRPPESEPKEVDMAAIEAKVAEYIAPLSGDTPPVAAPSPTRKLAMPGKDPDPTPEPGSVDPDPLVPEPKAGEQKPDDCNDPRNKEK